MLSKMQSFFISRQQKLTKHPNWSTDKSKSDMGNHLGTRPDRGIVEDLHYILLHNR